MGLLVLLLFAGCDHCTLEVPRGLGQLRGVENALYIWQRWQFMQCIVSVTFEFVIFAIEVLAATIFLALDVRLAVPGAALCHGILLPHFFTDFKSFQKLSLCWHSRCFTNF